MESILFFDKNGLAFWNRTGNVILASKGRNGLSEETF
jgi:hypothetical protein